MQLQQNTEPEEGADKRKYCVGTILTFRSYDPEEVAALGGQHQYTFRRGDKLRVKARNGCGMGIDVERVGDGVSDMVWPNEVAVSRNQDAGYIQAKEGA